MKKAYNRQYYSLYTFVMTKSNLVVGLLAAVALVVGISATKSVNIASGPKDFAAVAVSQDAEPSKTVTVTYTGIAFLPNLVTVNRGDSVVIVNKSSSALRVAPFQDPENDSTAYLGFSSSKSVGYGESFGVSLTKSGVWGYKNLRDSKTVGVVVVR